MTLVTDVGLPPRTSDAAAWLDFLLSCPCRHKAIEGVIEDYPHVLAEILDRAMSERDRQLRAIDQAERHLTAEVHTPVTDAFWRGVHMGADPFAPLPGQPAPHDDDLPF